MRSEVTRDAETALETAAVALKSSWHERAAAEDRPDVPAWCVLLHVLIHQLEVEVQVGDRVPANIRADQISEGMRRDLAGANAPSESGQAGSAALPAPLNTADRALKIGINGRRPVVLDQSANRPGARSCPRIGQRIEVSVGQGHRLTISVDLSAFAIHGVRQTRVPDCVLRVGAGDNDVVACAERRQVPLQARIDGPADLTLVRAAEGAAKDPAAAVVEEVVIPHIDVVDHAGDLSLTPPLLDMQRANDVGPTLTAKGSDGGVLTTRLAEGKAI